MFLSKFDLMFGTSLSSPWLLCADTGADDGAGGGGSGKPGGGTGDDGKGDEGKNSGGGRGLLADAEDDDLSDDDAGKGKLGDAPKSFKYKIGDTEHDIPAAFWDAAANDGKGGINQAALLKSQQDTKAAHDRLANQLKAGVKGDVPDKAEGYLESDLIKDGLFMRPEGVTKIADMKTDDPGLVGFLAIAHKAKLTKEQFQIIVSDSMLLAEGFTPEPFDEAAELAKLGGPEKAAPQVRALKSWVTNLHKNGVLSAAEFELTLAFGKTAVGVQTLNKLRTQTGAKPIPLGEGGVEGELPSKEEWYRNKPHHSDVTAYEKWSKQGEQIFGTGAAGSSQAGLGVPTSSGVVSSSNSDDNGKSKNRRR